jgi:hypothetical protein
MSLCLLLLLYYNLNYHALNFYFIYLGPSSFCRIYYHYIRPVAAQEVVLVGELCGSGEEQRSEVYSLYIADLAIRRATCQRVLGRARYPPVDPDSVTYSHCKELRKSYSLLFPYCTYYTASKSLQSDRKVIYRFKTTSVITHSLCCYFHFLLLAPSYPRSQSFPWPRSLLSRSWLSRSWYQGLCCRTPVVADLFLFSALVS